MLIDQRSELHCPETGRYLYENLVFKNQYGKAGYLEGGPGQIGYLIEPKWTLLSLDTEEKRSSRSKCVKQNTNHFR